MNITLAGLSIQEQLQFIRDYASIDYIYSAIPKIEEQIILGLGKWFDVLHEEEYYDVTPELSAVYPKDKSYPHQITVECFASEFKAEGIGQNEQTMIYEPDSTTYDEFRIRGGLLQYNAEVKIKSTSRQSVSKLADAVLLGLDTEVRDFLSSIDITIIPNSIKLPDGIKRVEITKDTSKWEITLIISNLQTHWKQILTTDGEILKGIKYKINEN